jgi:glycosyltransferase involved in cell wall biosynthesis
MTLPTFSVAIETANLSVADLGGLRVTLEALAAQTVPITQAEEVLLTDSGDVPKDVLAELLSEFPWVRALRLPLGTGYEELKGAAVDTATSNVIVYADGDCYYEPTWLEALLEPFGDPSVDIVGGETNIDSSGPYGLAVAVTFSFTASTKAGVYKSERYHFNNVAFRRSVLQRIPVPTRRPCYRMVGLHAAALKAAGYVIWRQPRAYARHAPPNGFNHFVWRFLLFGHDGVVVPRLVAADARLSGRPRRRGRHTLALAWQSISQSAKKLTAELSRKPSRVVELVVVAPIVAAALTLQAAGAVGGLVASRQLLEAMPEEILRASTCDPGPPNRRPERHS